jgi:hypothetical protein
VDDEDAEITKRDLRTMLITLGYEEQFLCIYTEKKCGGVSDVISSFYISTFDDHSLILNNLREKIISVFQKTVKQSKIKVEYLLSINS